MSDDYGIIVLMRRALRAVSGQMKGDSPATLKHESLRTIIIGFTAVHPVRLRSNFRVILLRVATWRVTRYGAQPHIASCCGHMLLHGAAIVINLFRALLSF